MSTGCHYSTSCFFKDVHLMVAYDKRNEYNWSHALYIAGNAICASLISCWAVSLTKRFHWQGKMESQRITEVNSIHHLRIFISFQRHPSNTAQVFYPDFKIITSHWWFRLNMWTRVHWNSSKSCSDGQSSKSFTHACGSFYIKPRSHLWSQCVLNRVIRAKHWQDRK